MTCRLEHANICVQDLDEMIRFLQTAFPDFRIRHDAINAKGLRWVHIGSDETYLALNQATLPRADQWIPYSGMTGLNHLSFVVDDVESIRARLTAAGFRDSTLPNDHPHRRRIYFYDAEDNDWEFVQYLSEDPAERHDYDLPD